MKKRILPVSAILAPYLMTGLCLCLIRFTPEVLEVVPPLLIYCFLLLLGPVLGFVYLLMGVKSPSLTSMLLAKWNLWVKLVHIPFYVAIFLVATLALPLFAIGFFFLDAAVLILSSGFGIAAILRSRKEGHLTTGSAVLHTILHCIFVADVISAFLVYRKLKAE